MKRIFVFIVILLGLYSFSCFAQVSDKRIVSRNLVLNSGKNALQLKWYSANLYDYDQLEVYRKEIGTTGDWLKVSKKPIKKTNFAVGKTISTQESVFAKKLFAEYDKDSLIKAGVGFTNNTKSATLKGPALLVVLIASFRNEVFAEYLGIQYTDSNVAMGKTYQYQLRSTKAGKAQAYAFSQEITVSTTYQTDAPLEIVAKQDKQRVNFSWKPEENRYWGVNIYKKIKEQFVKINSEPIMISSRKGKDGKAKYAASFFADDSVKKGESYTYKLTALDFFGFEGKYSPEITTAFKDLIPPPAPFGLAIPKSDNKSAKLEWKVPASDDIATLKIWRAKKSKGPYTEIVNAGLDKNSTSFTDLTVSEPGQYFYYVSAVDAAGNETKSNITFTEILDLFPPAIPQKLSIKSDSGKIILKWQANKESDLLGYRIYRTITQDKNGNYILLNTNPLDTTFYIDKLPKNAANTFFYKINAIDTAYNASAYTDPVNAKLPDITAPSKPFLKKITEKEGQLTITWLQNYEADFKFYHLYKVNADNNKQELGKNTLTKSITSFDDDKVEIGVNNRYILVAEDSAENISIPSDTLSFIISPKTNDVVSNNTPDAKLDKKKNRITINWKPEKLAKGYVLYKKISANTQYLPLTGLTDKTYYEDNTIDPKNIYEVRVYLTSGQVIRLKEVEVDKD